MESETLPTTASSLGSGFPSEPVIEHILSQSGVQRVPTPKLTLFLRKRFLDPAMCHALMERIDRERRPSTVSDFNGDTKFRTSETCDMDPADPLVIEVESMIHDFCRIDPAHGERLQGQRYEVGQEFKGHTDYFERTGIDYEKFCGASGNRTWTVMLYLNEPLAGGATRFKAIDKIVQPETGKLLAWNNLRPDGTPNPSTIHHGMKVRSGTKYVLTKWFRERPWG